jgi:hypothetical protein
MRNLLAFLAALLITLAVVGWFQNWFQFRTTASPEGNRNLTIDIDTTKVSDDVNKAEKNVQQYIEDKSKNVNAPPATTTPAKDK